MPDLENFLHKVLDASGGQSAWEAAQGLQAVFSADGLLFRTKRRRPFRRSRLRLSIERPVCRFEDYPEPGQTGHFTAERVAIVDRDGSTPLDERNEPRRAFSHLRKQFRWDELDMLYFASYAMWNYLTLPRLLLRSDLLMSLAEQRGGYRLEVTFPPHLPTHCRRQIFRFDNACRLIRHDYTALVVGPWAHAAHACAGHRCFGGLWFPTRRRVTPLPLAGRPPLPGPTLVAIDLHDVALCIPPGIMAREPS